MHIILKTSTPPHKKLSTNAPHFPQMRSARGTLTNGTAELLPSADTAHSTWSPHVHNPVEKKTQMCCARAAPKQVWAERTDERSSKQSCSEESAESRERLVLRAAARRPPPQLLSSALSCTNTTGWQPRLSTKYEWLLWSEGAPGKEQFF